MAHTTGFVKEEKLEEIKEIISLMNDESSSICKNSKDATKNLQIVNDFLHHHPGEWEALYLRGRLLCEEERYMEGAKDLKLALTLNPKSKPIQQSLANLRDDLQHQQKTHIQESLPDSLMEGIQGEDGELKIKNIFLLLSWPSDVLLHRNVIHVVATEMKGSTSPALLEAGWAFFKHMVEDPEAISLKDRMGEEKGEESKNNAEKDKNGELLNEELRKTKSRIARNIDRPIEVSDICGKCREAVGKEWSPDMILSELKTLVRAGLSDESAGVKKELKNGAQMGKRSDSEFRARASLSIVSILPHLLNMDQDPFYDGIETGLSAVGSNRLPRAALSALGLAADIRRRQGTKVKAVRCSSGTVKCMASTLALGENEELEDTVSTVLTGVLLLLADKERANADMVDMDFVSENLIGSYLESSEDCHVEWKLGLMGLNSLLAADRDVGRAFIIKKQLLPFFIACASDCQAEVPTLPHHAIRALMSAANFPELRRDLIELGGAESIMRLMEKEVLEGAKLNELKKNKLKNNKLKKNIKKSSAGALGATLSRLCIHDNSVRQSVFRDFDFFTITDRIVAEAVGEPIEECVDSVTWAIEILFFLSMHGEYKKRLLKKSECLSRISALGNRIASNSFGSSPKYMFAGTIYNLLRYQDDKEPRERKRKAGDIDLDEQQLDELEKVYQKLPEDARPQQNGAYDMGSEATANEMKTALVENNVLQNLASVICSPYFSSFQLTNAACRAIRLMAAKPDLRGKIVSQGGLKALLKGAEVQSSKPDELRHTRQAMAHICITVNPSLFSYQDSLDMVPHFIALLGDDYELYEYEAALALTNLTSASDDVRARCYHGKGWEAFGNLLFSDNPLLKGAGMEGYCNLSCSPLVAESVGKGHRDTDLHVMLAFAGEPSDPRIQHAAAGALATLAQDPQAGTRIAKAPNWDGFLQTYSESKDPAFLMRCDVLLPNVLQSEGVTDDLCRKIQKCLQAKGKM